MDEFTARSTFLQTEPGLMWTAKPFATRATDGEGSRVTLRHGVLRRRAGTADPVDVSVDAGDVGDGGWSALLHEHFGLVDTPERG
jgi:hypothetical protein